MEKTLNDDAIKAFNLLDTYSDMITTAHKKQWKQDKDFPTSGYLLKMLEELGEIQTALKNMDRENAMEETIDFIFTGFMMLNHLEVTKEELKKMVRYVIVKQERRVREHLPELIQEDIAV